MRFLLFALGSVTGRCLYLGSLNEGCKGWEGSRDNLYLGLLIKGQGIRNLSFVYTSAVLPLLTPSSMGRVALSRTAWRGRCTRPQSLRAS